MLLQQDSESRINDDGDDALWTHGFAATLCLLSGDTTAQLIAMWRRAGK
jgi:hypothetical protein